jgi:hypothetical protein
MDEREQDPGREEQDAEDVQADEPAGSHPSAQERTAYTVEDEELA